MSSLIIYSISVLFVCLVYGKELKSYNEILHTLKYPEKLILDISEATKGVKNDEYSSIEASEFVLTPLVFDTNEIPWKNEGLDYEKNPNVNYTGLIINKTKVGDEQKDLLHTVVFQWNHEHNANQTLLLQHLITFRANRKDLKIALWVDHYFVTDISADTIIPLADTIIVSVKLSLRYSNFTGDIKNMLNSIKPKIRHINPNCSIILQIKPQWIEWPSLHRLTEEERNRYFHFIVQSSVAWINSGIEEGIILDGFRWSDGEINWLSNSELRSIVSVGISQQNPIQVRWNPFSPVTYHYHPVKVLHRDICNMQIDLKKVTSTFSNVVVDATVMKEILNIVKTENAEAQDKNVKCIISPPFSETLKKLKFNVNIFVDDLQTFVTSEEFLGIKENEIQYDLLIFHFPMQISLFSPNITVPPKTLREQLKSMPKNATIGCLFGWRIDISNTEALLYDIQSRCKLLINQTQFTLVWYIELEISNLDKALKQLETIHKVRNKLLNESNSKEIWIQYRHMEAEFWDDRVAKSLYCNPTELLSNVIAEAVVNFARVHQLPIINRNALKYGHTRQNGWWSRIGPYDAVNPKSILVARNYPKFYTIPGFPTDPCISPTNLNEGIPLYPEFSGTTLYIDGPLLEKEIGNLFLFTLHRFSLIEIIPRTKRDIFLALKVLLLPMISKQCEGKQLYLQLNVDDAIKEAETRNLLLNSLSKLTTKITGIHCVGCIEKMNILNQHSAFFSAVAKLNMKFGLVLENYVEIVTNNFEPISKLDIFPTVDYILFNGVEGKIQATNEDKVNLEYLLDWHLFVKKSHQQVFKNRSKELLFRFNPIPYLGLGKGKADENYLRFVGDVSQYAKAYKMKFFMSPAFDNKNGTRLGWWKIINFDDLANVSVFVEKESPFFKRDSWRPSEEVSSSIFSSPVFIIGVSVLTTVLTIAVAVLLPVIWYRKTYALISRDEVELFLNGTKEGSAAGHPGVREEIEKLKFLKEYEIPEENFFLLNILGQGNFGVVYRAQLTLDDEQNSIQYVAVKMPLPKCSKESFMSMLTELKMLCYVGQHPNLLRFIGAHIREIGRGKVYIATEICENGALIDYLRSIKDNLNLTQENGEKTIKESITRLARFAHEICIGMDYLGSKNIIHADLSAKNVLLNGEFTCKIGDFGLSVKLYEYQEYVKKGEEKFPWRWAALEVLRENKFTTKSDVWSYGVTLWEIYSLGNVPYPGETWTTEFVEKLESGLRLTSPALASEIIYERMTSCWDSNPEERPTFSELGMFFESSRNMEYVCVGEL